MFSNSSPMRNIAILLFLVSVSFPAVAQQSISYTVLDGSAYKGDQLKWAVAHPVFAEPPTSKDGWYSVHKSADGHFYLSGSLNGYPVVFLVDTGSTKTAVGLSIARNAGIRAGLTGKSQTANGVGAIATSSGNQIDIGPFGFSGIEVIVTLTQNMPTLALLGMDILKQFQMHQTKDTLMLKIDD